MKTLLQLSLALGLILATPVRADGVDASRAGAGKSALQQKDYDAARAEFDAGLAAARESADVDAQVRFLFYRGLTEQAEGEAHNDEAALERAIKYYKGVLSLRPDSGSTLVNLARVVHRLGGTDEAHELYRRAIGLDDARRSAYEQSYAEFLQSIGRGDQAVSYYRRLVRADPQNAVAHEALARYYLDPARDWAQLEKYLWELVRSGEVDRALDAALESLGSREQDDERVVLLTVIATALSQQALAPEAFLESSTAEFLSGFSDDPAIGRGVQGLFAVFGALTDDSNDRWRDNNPYEGMDFTWWELGDSRRDLEVGIYPRDAFRRLMRSLGARYAQRGQLSIAKACYETAATFTGDELDPAAIRDLVDLYGRTGEIDKIEELASRYEFNLFEAKGAAYRNSQLEKIYQFHRTLGQIYGYLAEKTGDWGSSGKANSAIFQLERAVRVGQELDSMAADEPERHDYHVDPGLVYRLAKAYDATGKQARGDELRLEAAERYESAGDQRAKTYVLRPVDNARLQPAQQLRYEKLVAPRAELPDRPQIERRIDPKVKNSIEGTDPTDG